MTRSPSPAALKYLSQRAADAERMHRIAVAQRLGATVIKRRLRTWHLRRGELEAALVAANAPIFGRAKAGVRGQGRPSA